MTLRRFFLPAFPVLLALTLAACGKPLPPPETSETSVQMRAYQSRIFDTADRNRTLRAVIATLLDLGYVINTVDADAGTVSATKLSALNLSVAVAPRGKKQMSVRANAQIGGGVDDPRFYQQYFFEPLAGAMFLDAHLDEGDDSPISEPAAKTGTKSDGKVKR